MLICDVSSVVDLPACLVEYLIGHITFHLAKSGGPANILLFCQVWWSTNRL